MRKNWKLNRVMSGGITTIQKKKKHSKYKNTRTARPELATYYPNRKKDKKEE